MEINKQMVTVEARFACALCSRVEVKTPPRAVGVSEGSFLPVGWTAVGHMLVCGDHEIQVDGRKLLTFKGIEL